MILKAPFNVSFRFSRSASDVAGSASPCQCCFARGKGFVSLFSCSEMSFHRIHFCLAGNYWNVKRRQASLCRAWYVLNLKTGQHCSWRTGPLPDWRNGITRSHKGFVKLKYSSEREQIRTLLSVQLKLQGFHSNLQVRQCGGFQFI